MHAFDTQTEFSSLDHVCILQRGNTAEHLYTLTYTRFSQSLATSHLISITTKRLRQQSVEQTAPLEVHAGSDVRTPVQ